MKDSRAVYGGISAEPGYVDVARNLDAGGAISLCLMAEMRSFLNQKRMRWVKAPMLSSSEKGNLTGKPEKGKGKWEAYWADLPSEEAGGGGG